MKVTDYLNEAIKIFNERNTLYGDTYKRTGNAMNEIMPEKINLESKKDYTRMFILITIIGKIIRYSNNFSCGGHKDSLLDIITYSAMLMEVDDGK